MTGRKAWSIYGPPGTGKTTTLMRVITRLIEEGYSPEEIAFVSHTRAAAEEALSRMGGGPNRNVCTVHSMAFRLLGMTTQQVVDNRKLREFSKAVNIPITGRGIEDEDRAVGDEYLDIIGYAKNRGIGVREAYSRSGRPGKMEQFMAFAEGYERWKSAYGYKDFNDMLLDCAAAGLRPDVRAIIVDEAQDLSSVQWRLIRQFVEPEKVDRIYIALDDDQCIHTWAGADINLAWEFERDYQCERWVLDKSYRLPDSIHALSQLVISRIPDRVDKAFTSNGSPGKVTRCTTVWDLDIGEDEDVLVLARTHRELTELEEYFVRYRIPYSKKGGRSYYDSPYARCRKIHDKMAAGGLPTDSDLRLLDRYATSIGRRYLDDLDFERFSRAKITAVIRFPYGMESYYTTTDFTRPARVQMMTIHASKGREADRVVVNTKLPQRIKKEWDRLKDEETRLFYVALTRSKSRLDVILDPNGFRLPHTIDDRPAN